MYNIGIDLGGTSVKVGIVNEDYKIIAKSSAPTNCPCPAEEIVDTIANLVTEICDSNGISLDEIGSIGIGTPGAADSETGVVVYSNNLQFDNVPLGEMLSKKINKAVSVENDANAAAYGEFISGSGKGYSNVIVVTLGTGVGTGIVLDGKIYSGFNFSAGEIGHTVIVKDGVPCTCGRKGCFESYSSATGLIRMTKEKMQEHKDSLMWQIAPELDDVNGLTAFDGMRKGDKAAKEVVDEFMDYLGCGITNIVNAFQPEILLIGGGLSKEGDNLIKPLNEYVQRECYKVDRNKTVVIGTAKLGNDAGIIGAAFLLDMKKC